MMGKHWDIFDQEKKKIKGRAPEKRRLSTLLGKRKKEKR